MRDSPWIWETWRSGNYLGDRRPSVRVTVEKGWHLLGTGPVIGSWNRGPAHYYTGETDRVESEVPNVQTVSIQRAIDSDAASCDITLLNVNPTVLGEPEAAVGQYGDSGYYTWDHGRAQEARARWGHTTNPWNDVLVPNALLRTYVGFGGEDKPLGQAIDDGNVVLYGVWLVDDVVISTQGTINVRCRDMGKLLVDQQLFPPLVPRSLYPVTYRRWIKTKFQIPADVPSRGSMCFPSQYAGSSVDEVYGQYNTGATGHPPGEAFDISGEPGPDIPGAYAHQRTYWLSEPKAGPTDTVWIEFTPLGAEAGDINQIYYHAWAGNYRIMVSVFEDGQWAPAETSDGGVTPDGIPFVSTFTCGWEGDQRPGATNLYDLLRDYRATRIRLTITNLIAAAEGGHRAGARKIMACFSAEKAAYPHLVFAGAGIPVNTNNRLGYWQVRSNGQVYAFGDARTYDWNSPANTPRGTVLAMAAHPSGDGYWILDAAGRVLSAGQAQHFGDLGDAGYADAQGFLDVVDLAPTPSGNGYWILRKNGEVYGFGDATWYGNDDPSGTMPSGGPLISRSIESHPTQQGYWILRSDGIVKAFNLAHQGDANRVGFTLAEYVASIRRTSTGNGYWITSGGGTVQAFGDAPHKGNADMTRYQNENWAKGLCWDLIPTAENDQGYAIQHADGTLDPRGDITGLVFGSVGSGTGWLRYPGNYLDYCLDAETEVLTKRGWLTHDQVEVGDEAWSLDPATGQARWAAVQHVHRYEHDGHVLHLNGRFIDAVATPNHRWIVNSRWREDLQFKTSDELRQTHTIPLRPPAGVEGPAPTIRDEFVELVAWFWTEGCIERCPRGARILIAQSERANPDYVDRIDKCLRTLYGEPARIRDGGRWYRATRRDGIVTFRLSPKICPDLLRAAPGKVPTVDWLTQLSPDQRIQFVMTSLDADGHRRANVWTLCQADGARARSFETACVLAGYGVSARKSKNGMYNVTVLRRHSAQPITSRRDLSGDTYWAHHKGLMWCPTTSTGTWLARRNGRSYFTGNCDIIRDLLLWAGFYLYRKNPSVGDKPEVYGNIESTGAWSDDDLPVSMFDKRPIIEAIREIRDIVGYVFFIDAEGGARFESPNWWAIGNYLMDGTPFSDVPEIDEVVQLTSHSVTFSANQARSELIVAPEDPTPREPGKESPAANKATIIRPRTADDLRGLIVPAMWIQGEFLSEKERRIMADLLDMKMWFSRRTAQIDFVANPLIDINDQVRVIERQTGEVYVHYVRSVSFNFDRGSGEFSMSLSTHWLGGTPYGSANLHLACDSRPQGDGYWQTTITGGVYAFGAARIHDAHQANNHDHWVVAFRSTHTGAGYYTLDVSGRLLTYGDAVHRGDLTRPALDATDIALTPSGAGYWILCADGSVTAFGDATWLGHDPITGTMPSGAAIRAESIESHPSQQGYWVLLSDGTVRTYGVAHYGNANRDGFTFTEYVSCLRASSGGNGYWIVSGSGIVQAFGNAPHRGNGTRYPDTDFANGLVWDMLTNPTDGYALQHADGHLEAFAFNQLGEAGATGPTVMWALMAPETAATLTSPTNVYVVSPETREFLAGTGSPSANNAAASNFDAPAPATIKAPTS